MHSFKHCRPCRFARGVFISSRHVCVSEKHLMRKYWSTETSDLYVPTLFILRIRCFFFGLLSPSLSLSSSSSFVCLHKYFFSAPHSLFLHIYFPILCSVLSVCLGAHAISFVRRGSAFFSNTTTSSPSISRYRARTTTTVANILKGNLSGMYILCVAKTTTRWRALYQIHFCSTVLHTLTSVQL